MGHGYPLPTFLKGPGAPPSDCGKRLHSSNEKDFKVQKENMMMTVVRIDMERVKNRR